jgi:SPASM domain peptide maturase of grasp-with-spasm system
MKKIRLFACCIPVKGAKKSIICDIQRNTYKPIPNSMYEFLVKYENYSIEDIKNDFPIEDHETIDEYVDFLLNEEFAFFTDNPEFYPKLEPQWKSPSKITNAVIDINEYSTHDYAAIFGQLDALRCLNIEIRFFDICSIGKLEEIISLTDNGTLCCIDIILKFDITLIDRSKLKDILTKHLRVNNIFIHSTPGHFIEGLNTDDNLIYTSQVIENETHCGIINKSNFSANQNLFFESQSFNNCLNRKISIDSSGQIKNCPSMPISFGDIQNTDLLSVIENEEFKKPWTVTKDQIDICKDCEFRYICTDCRAYVKNENDPFSKPQKCNYNPYLAIWE